MSNSDFTPSVKKMLDDGSIIDVAATPEHYEELRKDWVDKVEELGRQKLITIVSNREVERLLNEQTEHEATVKAMEDTMAQQQELVGKQAETILRLNAAIEEKTAVIRILGRML